MCIQYFHFLTWTCSYGPVKAIFFKIVFEVTSCKLYILSLQLHHETWPELTFHTSLNKLVKLTNVVLLVMLFLQSDGEKLVLKPFLCLCLWWAWILNPYFVAQSLTEPCQSRMRVGAEMKLSLSFFIFFSPLTKSEDCLQFSFSYVAICPSVLILMGYDPPFLF